jgi:hypothetical protein
MKRCPKCNQEFADEWLTFCTQDGTSLVDVAAPTNEPPPTLLQPPMPPSVSPAEQPTLDMPGRYSPPPVQFSDPPFPQPLQSGWMPPPPPAYPTAPNQSLAVASLVLGLVSITFGWCCSIGLLTSPVAIALGIVSLVQIKNSPTKYGGKPFGIGGIVTGGLYFAILALIILLYGIGFILSGLR